MEERKQEAKRAPAVPDSAAEEGIVARQPALLLAGKRKRIITEKGREALAQIQEFWAECEADGTLAALRDLAPDARCYVAANHNFEKYAYDYWIAIEVLEEEPQIPAGFETLQTEETEYALFPCKGPGLKSAFERWGFVYRKWFPRGHYFHGTSPELEVYPFGDMEAEGYESELRVPVKKVPPDYYRRKRRPMRMMLLPLAGVFIGLLVGTQAGNATVGMLVGLLGGFVAATILQQIQDDKNKKKDLEEGEEEKEK